MKHITSIIFAALALLVLPACTTISGPRVDTKTAVTNAASVAAPLIEGGARIAVPMILTKNPQLVDDFALSASAAATILATSNPTAEGFSAAVRVAFPEVTQAQATQIGAALESAYASGAALFKAQTGRDLVLTSIIADPEYKAAADALVTALVRGVSNGIADYRASLPES